LLAFIITVLLSFSQHSVQFIISLLPLSSADTDFFVAGSFNGWDPQDKNFHFEKNANGNYFLGTKLANGMYEFKITRGNWDKVECKKGGTDIQNRSFNLTSDTTINLVIEEWADKVEKKPGVSTANSNVHIIDTAFSIPQLKTTRRIWIYLPPGYKTSKKNYPVLYMQDGQNVFDEKTSFSGEWGVDETLDSISRYRRGMIVVAIDHGGTKRINEYCPYDMKKYGKGEWGSVCGFFGKHIEAIH